MICGTRNNNVPIKIPFAIDLKIDFVILCVLIIC